jgi:hypothetical protein
MITLFGSSRTRRAEAATQSGWSATPLARNRYSPSSSSRGVSTLASQRMATGGEAMRGSPANVIDVYTGGRIDGEEEPKD